MKSARHQIITGLTLGALLAGAWLLLGRLQARRTAEPASSPTTTSLAAETTNADSAARASATAAEPWRAELTRLLSLGDDTERLLALKDFFARLPHELFPAVAELFRGVPEDRAIERELCKLVEAWSTFGGAAPVEFLGSLLPREGGLPIAASYAVGGWMRQDREGALHYLKTMRGGLEGWRATVVRSAGIAFAQTDLDAGLAWAEAPDPDRVEAIRAVATWAAPEQRPKVAAWLSHQLRTSPDPQFAETFREFSFQYAESDPMAAVAWSTQSLPRSYVQELSAVTTLMLAGSASPQQALEFAQRSAQTIQPAENFPGWTDQRPLPQRLVFAALRGALESPQPMVAIDNLALLANPDDQAEIIRLYHYFANRREYDDYWSKWER